MYKDVSLANLKDSITGYKESEECYLKMQEELLLE